MARFSSYITDRYDDAFLDTGWNNNTTLATLKLSNSSTVFARYQIQIPRGCKINSANFTMRAGNTDSTGLIITIGLCETVNIPSLEFDRSGLTYTVKTVSWTMPSFTTGQYYQSTDIGHLVGSFINKKLYDDNGVYIGFRFLPTSGGGTRSFYQFGAPSSFPDGLLLSIDFDLDSTISFATGVGTGVGSTNKKTSIIQLPDKHKQYLSRADFVFTDTDSSTFTVRTTNNGVVDSRGKRTRKPAIVGSVRAGYLEIDLPPKKYTLHVVDPDSGHIIATDTIDQRPKGTYGRKTSRKDAGGVNLVDTTETKTARGATVVSPTHVSVNNTERGATITNTTNVTSTSRGATVDNS